MCTSTIGSSWPMSPTPSPATSRWPSMAARACAVSAARLPSLSLPRSPSHERTHAGTVRSDPPHPRTHAGGPPSRREAHRLHRQGLQVVIHLSALLAPNVATAQLPWPSQRGLSRHQVHQGAQVMSAHTPCKCTVNDGHIVSCPLHAAAPRMLAALTEIA